MPISAPERPGHRAAPLLAVACLTPALCAGGPAYQHNGAVNPVTEGWQVLGGGTNVVTGPATPIATAWFVNDQGTEESSTRWYRAVLTPKEAADALAEGWTLRACLEVVALADDVDSAIFLEYRDGTRTFSLQFGSDVTGLPIVEIIDDQGPPACDSWSGPSFAISTAGGCLEPEFHLYEMTYAAALGIVTVRADGEILLSEYAGFMPAGSQEARIDWGSSHGCRTGHSRFATVQFEIGTTVCPFDCAPSGDVGVVGISDLLELLGDWGQPGPCDLDGGGTGINDLLGLLAVWGPCPGSLGCGQAGSGSCYLANGSPGCENFACCGAVCDADPSCCDVEWDAGCATLAFTTCGDCGEPAAGACCAENGTPGCDDAGCCQSVCVIDPFCCNFAWDELCADQAAKEPGCGCG